MGKTIIVAEHRLYYLNGVADRVIYLKDGRIAKICLLQIFQICQKPSFGKWGCVLCTQHLHRICRILRQMAKLFNYRLSFSYGNTETENIPQLSVPRGGIVGVLVTMEPENHLCQMLVWIGKISRGYFTDWN